MRRPPTRVVVGVGLLLALFLAGFVSYYASTSPDGLNRVAQDQGFSQTQKEHVAADGPLAGYRTRGVEDSRLSDGLARVLGAGAVLLLASGLTFAVRRRGGGEDRDQRTDQHAATD